MEQELSDEQMLRFNAEQKLGQNKKVIPEPEMDVKRLIHELQVHQIELEMQNDELKQANEIAETALKKFTMLYDFAPMGYLTIDSDGIIDDLNFTAAEMLGGRRFSLTNSNIKFFIHHSSKHDFSVFLKKIYAGHAKESCQVVLGYDNNLLGTMYIEGIVIGDDQKCLLSIIDISAFKK